MYLCLYLCVGGWMGEWLLCVRACVCHRLTLVIILGHTKQMRHSTSNNKSTVVLFSIQPTLLSASFRQRFTIWDLFIRSFVRSLVHLFVCLTVLAAYFHCKLFFLFGIYSADINQGVELEPEFLGSISNVTYPVGREAVLTCSVKNLGKYKVSVIISWLPH